MHTYRNQENTHSTHKSCRHPSLRFFFGSFLASACSPNLCVLYNTSSFLLRDVFLQLFIYFVYWKTDCYLHCKKENFPIFELLIWHVSETHIFRPSLSILTLLVHPFQFLVSFASLRETFWYWLSIYLYLLILILLSTASI